MRIDFVILCAFCVLVALTSAFGEQSFFECPSISLAGYPPNCVCRYGPAYDNATNTCPDPECPTSSSVESSYPNCYCTEKNFGYSVSPVNSTGYWPNCVCDDKLAGFDKKKFICTRCPEDSDDGSIFPKCTCDSVGQYSEIHNECLRCNDDSTGMYPNCTCISEDAVFNSKENACELCPIGSSGKVPNCKCDNGAEYNEYGNYCEPCPDDSVGNYPNCECSNNGYFDGKYCEYCPWGANGTYPNCTCEEGATYLEDTNQCMKCPDGRMPCPLSFSRCVNRCGA